MSTEILGYTHKGKPIYKDTYLGNWLEHNKKNHTIEDLKIVIESMEKRIIALERESINKFIKDKMNEWRTSN